MFQKEIVKILLSIFALGTLQAQETYNTLLYKGNQNFDRQKYDQAASTFREAAKNKKKDFGAHYNLGNALYKKKKYEQAKSEYLKAQAFTQDASEKAASLYNLGNAHMQSGELAKAIESFKEALKNDPDNQAILKNLQIAKKQKHHQQNQRGPGKSNPQNGKDPKDQNQSKDPSGEQENKNPNAKTQDDGNLGKEGQGQGSYGKKPNLEQKNQPPNKNELPKNVQELLLQRNAEQERETSRNIQSRKAYSVPESNEKDW